MLRVLFGVRNDNLIAERPEFSANALGDLGEKRVHEIGNDQSHHVRSPRHQAASDPVGPVIQLARTIHYAAPGLFADIAMAPQRLRNSHQRHTQILGDVLHSRTQSVLLYDSVYDPREDLVKLSL